MVNSSLFLSVTPVVPRNIRGSRSAPMEEGPRAKVYIDGANIFYTQKSLGWVIDWQKVKDLLNKKYDIVEFRYYTGVKLDWFYPDYQVSQNNQT